MEFESGCGRYGHPKMEGCAVQTDHNSNQRPSMPNYLNYASILAIELAKRSIQICAATA